MRMKIEFVLIAAFMAITWQFAYGVQFYKCGGAYNCKLVNCYDAAKEGFSCGLVTAVTHKACEFTGDENDDCTTVRKKCALVNYYSGGPCDNNNAPYCGGFDTGKTKDLYEDGCDQ